MLEGWYIRARRFICEQRAKELKRAIAHFPNSDRLQLRKDELEDIEKELKELEDAR